jgi:hypothetical protein
MASNGNQPVRSKRVKNDQPIEQVQSYTFLGYKLTYRTGYNTRIWNISGFNYEWDR